MLDAYTGERPAGPAGESMDAGVHVMGRLVGKYCVPALCGLWRQPGPCPGTTC